MSLYIPGNLSFPSLITVQAYDVRKQLSTLWPDGNIRLFAHVHYLIIIIMQTYLTVLNY